MKNTKIQDRFNFGCLMSAKQQTLLKEYALQGKQYDKRFSQGKLVEFALNKVFDEINREGFEFVFRFSKKLSKVA